MTHVDKHPQIVFQEWNNVLGDIRDVLNHYPHAETITMIHGERSEKTSTPTDLIKALEPEMTGAAEYLPVPTAVLSLLPTNKKINPVVSITGSISVFKAPVLRNYIDAIDTELEGVGSPSDISVVLNRLGFSSVAVATDKISDYSSSSRSTQTNSREWAGYVSHVELDWSLFEKPAPIHFSSLFDTEGKPRILIDASGLEATMNGTARNVLSFLDYVERLLSSHELEWNVTAVIPTGSLEFFGRTFDHISCVNALSDVPHTNHLGISITPITSIQRCVEMNTLCVRWVVEHLDIIAIRALPFLSQQTEALRAIRLYLTHADQVVFISHGSQKDTDDFFGLDKASFSPQRVIPLGSPPISISAAKSVSQKPYVLVLGNNHPHKQVDVAVDALINAEFDVVSLSSGSARGDKHRPIAPGTLSDEGLTQLMSESSAIVFPSIYEGFGLPIAEAAALGKQVIVWDTSVSHEVSRLLNTEKSNIFCSTPEELVTATRQIIAHPKPVNTVVRTMDDFNQELLVNLADIVDAPVNKARLNSRWELFSLLRAVSEQTRRETTNSIAMQHWRTRLTNRFRKNNG